MYSSRPGTFCFEFCTDLFDTLFLLFYGYLNIADLQILAVARFIEETAAEYAREQYIALDRPSSKPGSSDAGSSLLSGSSGNNDDGFKLQLGAAGDSSMIGWINIDIMGGRAIRSIDDVQPLEVKKKYSTSILKSNIQPLGIFISFILIDFFDTHCFNFF